MVTSGHVGQSVGREWLGFMAAFIGLRWLYIVNNEAKLIHVTKIEYRGVEDVDIKEISHS
jgi:hypothetical protein